MNRQRRLEQRFVYLNPITGQVSSNTLTVRQLCRLLCPSNSARPSPMFTPQLQILELEEDDKDHQGGQLLQGESELDSTTTAATTTPRYSSKGWTVVTASPILREACAQYYYSFSNEKAASTASDSSRVTEGPVTCRQLAHIVSELLPASSSQLDRSGFMVWSPLFDEIASHDTVAMSTNDKEKATTLTDNAHNANGLETQQGSSSSNNSTGGWQKLDALLDLLAAMEAFDTTPMVPVVEPSGVDTETTDTAYDASTMIFHGDGEMETSPADVGDGSTASTGKKQRELSIQEELEAFLTASTGQTVANHHRKDEDDDENDDDEGYESDGGTHYMKDKNTGAWIEGSLPPKANQVAATKKATKTTTNNKLSTEVETKSQDANQTNLASDAAAVTTDNTTTQLQRSNKRKRPKFSAKHAKCWIYVSGLPIDTNEEEVSRFFSKVGIIALDPETQQPKVKLYRYSQQDIEQATTGAEGHEVGQLKGDASICYARPESVDLAVQILDEALFRPPTSSSSNESMMIRVERAKFEQHGETFDERRRRLATSRTKQKVVRLAALQAMDWDDEGDVNGRISGGRKGLRIIVLKHVFDPRKVKRQPKNNKKNSIHHDDHEDDQEEEEGWELQVERHVRQICEEFGTLEKITIFSKHREGVVLVKFVQPSAATEAVQHYNIHNHGNGSHGIEKWSAGRNIEASYWDGVTDYTVRDEEREQKEMERRQDEFGNWLEHQDLPEEFQLRVEEGHKT